jgi:hypothetical protein
VATAVLEAAIGLGNVMAKTKIPGRSTLSSLAVLDRAGAIGGKSNNNFLNREPHQYMIVGLAELM